MSDPLWFLENLEENESNSQQRDYTLNYNPSQNSGQKEWSSEDKLTQLSPQSQEKTNVSEHKATRIIDLLKDDEGLRAALQSSLMDSIKNGQNPGIRITVNAVPESNMSDLKLEGSNTIVDTSSQNETSNIIINLDNKDSGALTGEENKFSTNNSYAQNIEVDENSSNNKQTVYVILPPEQNKPSEIEPSSISDVSSSHQYKEVGSSIINLNDLLSSQANALSNNGEITANVDLSSVMGSSEGMPRVQLVIKVKDERVKPEQTPMSEDTALKTYTENEIARLKELLKNSATLESLDNQLQSGKTVRNIPIQVAPSTWPTTSYDKVSVSDTVSSQSGADWADKTTDTYKRRDGAQCTRTVWSSPQGRRVETRCVREDRGRRARTLDWAPRFGSFWGDSDIDRIFSYANRFF